MNVTIKNPIPGGATHVGMERAERLVKRRRATWISASVIAFVVEHHAHRTVPQVTDEEANRRVGYDVDVETSISTLAQISGLPCTDPRGLIAVGPSSLSRVHQRCECWPY